MEAAGYAIYPAKLPQSVLLTLGTGWFILRIASTGVELLWAMPMEIL